MSISAQLPPILLSPTTASLPALALAAGGTVDAKVLGQQPNGMTQVQIGAQVLALQLPSPPDIGAMLKFAVQQAEGKLSLTLISSTPPSSAAAVPTTTQANAPATQIQLSQAALSGSARPIETTGSTAPRALAPPVASVAPGSAAVTSAPLATSTPTVAPAVVAPQQAAPPTAAASGAVSALPPVASAHSVPSAVPAMAVTSPATPASVSPAGAPNVTSAPSPAIPYAVAAPVVPAAQLAGRPDVSPPVDSPVARTMAAAAIGQQALSPDLSAQGRTTASAPGGQATTTQAALTQMVQRSLPGQDSIVGLTTALSKVIGRVALPETVVRAAMGVLSHRLAVDGGKLTGAMVQRAVAGSGLFQEALLGAGQPKAAGADLKTALLGLQRSIGAWLGDGAPVEKVSGLPPPLRGMVPRARGGEMALTDVPDDPAEAGRVLMERTEAALSRLRLHQHASLPEPGQRQEAQWSLDVPVTIGNQQNVLQLQIHGDTAPDQNAPGDRGWQVRFAINLGETGEVGAQISLRGRSTGVLVWADTAETAALLEAGVGDLRQELESVGLHVGSVLIRSGAPVAQVVSSAHFLDETR